MDPWPVEADGPRSTCRGRGTPTWPGCWKFGFTDVRNVLERASARETAARVAGGAVCKAFLRALGSRCARTSSRSATCSPSRRTAGLTPASFAAVDDDPVRTLDPQASAAMVAHINVQRKANESIGGAFEVLAFGLVPGLGSHVSWEQRLDGRLAGALCSIQAVKGAEIGDPRPRRGPDGGGDAAGGHHRQRAVAGCRRG